MTTHFVAPVVEPGDLPMRPDTHVDHALDRLRNRLFRKPFCISIDLLDELLVAVETVAYALENDQIQEQHHDYAPDRSKAAAELYWIRQRTRGDLMERAWDVRVLIDDADSVA